MNPREINAGTFGERLSEALKRRAGKNQKAWIAETAAELGIPENTFSSYLYNKRFPDGINMQRLVIHFGAELYNEVWGPTGFILSNGGTVASETARFMKAVSAICDIAADLNEAKGK